jgi:hypothetical protein
MSEKAARDAIEGVWNAALDASNSRDFRLPDGSLDEERVLRYQANVITKALAAAIAEGRLRASADIRAEILAGVRMPPDLAGDGGRPRASAVAEWAARIAEGTEHG